MGGRAYAPKKKHTFYMSIWTLHDVEKVRGKKQCRVVNYDLLGRTLEALKQDKASSYESGEQEGSEYEE